MEEKIKKLKEIKEIQCNNGNWNYSDYMRGLANGLIMAVAILEDTEPKFFDPQKKYGSDKNTDETLKSKVIGWLHSAWH